MDPQKDVQKQASMADIRQIISEMIYPPYVPPKSRPNIDSLLYLLRNIDRYNNSNDSISNRHLDGRDTSPLEKLKRIEKSCQRYKLKYQEYHRRYEEMNRPRESEDPSSNKQDLMKTRAQVQIFNYHYCVTKETCPFRMEQLIHCWENYGLDHLKHSVEQGMESQVCQREREMVQRCTGKLVESFMRDVLE